MQPNIIYINSYVEGNKIDSLINEIKWVEDRSGKLIQTEEDIKALII